MKIDPFRASPTAEGWVRTKKEPVAMNGARPTIVTRSRAAKQGGYIHAIERQVEVKVKVEVKVEVKERECYRNRLRLRLRLR